MQYGKNIKYSLISNLLILVKQICKENWDKKPSGSIRGELLKLKYIL